MTGRGETPSLWRIASYWYERRRKVPGSRMDYIGIGEPMCFRCGWLAPVPDYAWVAEDHPDWSYTRVMSQVWRGAGRFLDRAHLVDYCLTHDNNPGNIVPLCHYPCHRKMPELFRTREGALAWVNSGEQHDEWWQVVTDGRGLSTSLHHRHQLERLHFEFLEAKLRTLSAASEQVTA